MRLTPQIVLLATALPVLATQAEITHDAVWYKCPLITKEAVESAETKALHKRNTGSLASRMADPLHLRDFTHLHKKSLQNEDTRSIECAQFDVPLCHPGICNAKGTIKSFVKRINARDPNSKKSVWMLQGGPGASSINMESMIDELYNTLNGTFTVYTMDHRGTGRSGILECPTAGAMAKNSEAGEHITVGELSGCLSEVSSVNSHDGAAFSVTSAATDLTTLAKKTNPDGEIYLYGLSYGTYVISRAMHLAPEGVKGYIEDSIQSEIFWTDKPAPYFSNWDYDSGEVASRFMLYCDEDPTCSSKIGPNSTQSVLDLYQSIDNGTFACSKDEGPAPTNDSNGTDPTNRSSIMVKKMFANLLAQGKVARSYIPAIVYRAKRCNEEDKKVLEHFYKFYNKVPTDTIEEGKTLSDPSVRDSEVLKHNILFSEIWEQPTPTSEQLFAKFDASLMASGMYEEQVEQYCMYTNSQEETCKVLGFNSTTEGFTYKRDQYWNVSATIPANSSALLFAGYLDPQTPWRYGFDEFNILKGDNKKLVEFNYSAHVVLVNTPVKDSNTSCGYSILASYLTNGGDLSKVDYSCQQRVEPFSIVLDEEAALKAFGTTDAFDGAYASTNEETTEESVSARASHGNNSNTTDTTSSPELIVLSTCLVASMCVIAVLAVYSRTLQQKLTVNEVKSKAEVEAQAQADVEVKPEVDAAESETTQKDEESVSV